MCDELDEDQCVRRRMKSGGEMCSLCGLGCARRMSELSLVRRARAALFRFLFKAIKVKKCAVDVFGVPRKSKGNEEKKADPILAAKNTNLCLLPLPLPSNACNWACHAMPCHAMSWFIFLFVFN